MKGNYFLMFLPGDRDRELLKLERMGKVKILQVIYHRTTKIQVAKEFPPKIWERGDFPPAQLVNFDNNILHKGTFYNYFCLNTIPNMP